MVNLVTVHCYCPGAPRAKGRAEEGTKRMYYSCEAGECDFESYENAPPSSPSSHDVPSTSSAIRSRKPCARPLTPPPSLTPAKRRISALENTDDDEPSRPVKIERLLPKMTAAGRASSLRPHVTQSEGSTPTPTEVSIQEVDGEDSSNCSEGSSNIQRSPSYSPPVPSLPTPRSTTPRSTPHQEISPRPSSRLQSPVPIAPISNPFLDALNHPPSAHDPPGISRLRSRRAGSVESKWSVVKESGILLSSKNPYSVPTSLEIPDHRGGSMSPPRDSAHPALGCVPRPSCLSSVGHPPARPPVRVTSAVPLSRQFTLSEIDDMIRSRTEAAEEMETQAQEIVEAAGRLREEGRALELLRRWTGRKTGGGGGV